MSLGSSLVVRRWSHYFVPRNSRGSLPVYTDIRNARSRHLTLVRNIEGDANSLAKDISETLFHPESPEAGRIKANVLRSRHLVITGGRWKLPVMHWLTQKGF